MWTVEDAVRTALLRDFTARNAGRLTRLEEDGPELGAQVEESSTPLRGIAYDPHGRSVEIMLGDLGTPEGHLTRSIANVESVDLVTDALGRDAALRIAHDDGQTLLRLVY
ncbi:MAG TPA: DUF5335 family protein [Longimicrobium sp.]